MDHRQARGARVDPRTSSELEPRLMVNPIRVFYARGGLDRRLRTCLGAGSTRHHQSELEPGRPGR
jgi:hypothetical protein